MRRSVAAAGLALLLAACSGQGEADNNAAASNAGAPRGASAQPGNGNLATLLAADPRFTALIRAAGMTKVFEGKEPYTVLAPTGEALDALPAGTLERLQQPAARAELTALLRQHVLPGTILAADLSRALEASGGKARLATMTEQPLTVTREGSALRIADASGAGARLVGSEQIASNGVIHRIDAVLPAPKGIGSRSD